MAGPIKVAGKDYGLVPMVPTIWVGWSDDDIAAVLTYIRNEWGNEAALVTPETVGRIRSVELVVHGLMLNSSLTNKIHERRRQFEYSPTHLRKR